MVYTHNQQGVIIPIHNNWIVTLWHFGTDSLVRYAGEKFEVTWEVAENVLVRAHTKIQVMENGVINSNDRKISAKFLYDSRLIFLVKTRTKHYKS
jgi:hypothetical protein